MAKGRIPIYEQQTNVANVPGSPHVTGEMAGAGIGRAVLGLGNDLGAAASIMSAREREAERVLQERDDNVARTQAARSEERRVGKEWRWRRVAEDWYKE